MRDNNRRNFGYGRRMDYAVKMALLLFYGYDQQYGTVRAHYTRFVRFMKWLQQFDGTRDARHLTVDHINTYADYLSGQVSEGMFKVSYAQNLLSSLNTCLTAIRGDQRLWVSPCQKVGRRSYIRTSAADGEWEQVDKVVKVLIDDRNLCGAAVVRLARALGMRLREAALADLERIHHELKKFGYCRILEGCKGGRRCDTRTIDASPRVMEAVGFALSVKQESSRNLIHPDQSLKQFFHTAIRKVRIAMKNNNLSRIHELRVKYAQELYEEQAGQDLPLTKPPVCKTSDERGRAAVARALGHGRSCIAKSYVGGKR